jgi:hypothetical protein
LKTLSSGSFSIEAPIMPDQPKIKLHSTNYFNTFIEVAEDTKASFGIKPPSRPGKTTIAAMQYELIATHPYQYTSDDVLFHIHAAQHALSATEQETHRQEFFSKGRACLRASPLTKSYGFGVHCNSDGKIALIGMEEEKYQEFLSDPAIKKVKAMRSSKK